ncbi:hypothetical protein [Brachybacterium huguangmaarense]
MTMPPIDGGRMNDADNDTEARRDAADDRALQADGTPGFSPRPDENPDIIALSEQDAAAQKAAASGSVGRAKSCHCDAGCTCGETCECGEDCACPDCAGGRGHGRGHDALGGERGRHRGEPRPEDVERGTAL